MGLLALAVSIAVPLGLGSLVGLSVREETSGPWYRSLNKPTWNPPGAVFGPVWAVLYVMMGVACWRVWVAGGGRLLAAPLVLYAIQLALNLAWSLAFFKAHSLKWALVDILALLAVLVATVAAFHRVDSTAGLLLLPYIAWVSFATLLTASLYLRNSNQPQRIQGLSSGDYSDYSRVLPAGR